MSKRGYISDEDRELFRQATGDVRRLQGDNDNLLPEQTRRTSHTGARTQAGQPGACRNLADSEWTSDIGPGDVLSFARGGVRRRDFERLRRGRFRIEADLDLHGRIVADAVTVLDDFLEDSRRRGRRCVRIVHGKGFGSRSGLPIMKSHVDRWLRARAEVLAFCSATPPDGGTGALYVLLRR